MAKIINSEEFEKIMTASEKPVLADFFSETCGPCRRMSPILDEISEEFADKLSVVKINIGSDPELAIDYGVQYVPTMILFRNGEEQTRITGAVSRDELIDTMLNA